ncbi:MAG: hypothetical protein RL637_1647, partial [Pseudomonadota bacterium]
MTIKTAVLLVNLGSPDSTEVSAVRRFLRRFLSDKRVVNLPRILWLPILHCIILPFRPYKSAKAYREIWLENGSPLAIFTASLAQKLARQLATDSITIDYAMSYAVPEISQKLTEWQAANIEKLIVLPLYPQYSSTTTASVYDEINRFWMKQYRIPQLHFICDYHQQAFYIQALAQSIRHYWQEHGQEYLLISFHGLPAKLTEWGDPYFYQCQQTAQLLIAELNLNPDQWQLVFQSRFGRAEWLKPYCVEVLEKLPHQGIKKIQV